MGRTCGSGRNSGVLHAGFYYTADSLKARFTRDGNAALKDLLFGVLPLEQRSWLWTPEHMEHAACEFRKCLDGKGNSRE